MTLINHMVRWIGGAVLTALTVAGAAVVCIGTNLYVDSMVSSWNEQMHWKRSYPRWA